MNKDAKRYYKEIKTIIPSRGNYEKRLLKDYKNRILELNGTQLDLSYDDLQQELGNPIEIINEYYESVDTQYLMKRLRTTKILRRCIYCILVLALVSFSVSVGVNIKLYHDIHHTIIKRERTIIE